MKLGHGEMYPSRKDFVYVNHSRDSKDDVHGWNSSTEKSNRNSEKSKIQRRQPLRSYSQINLQSYIKNW